LVLAGYRPAVPSITTVNTLFSTSRWRAGKGFVGIVIIINIIALIRI
jgi:hypothetical protein